ncbi:MAG: 23S rRNA (cytosine1962-C5)-methyltransferase [Cocleimonas sp.]
MSAKLPINSSELLENLVIPKNEDLEQAQRIFHGRGHAYKDLSHITIDWLKPLILITLFAPVSKVDLLELVNQLKMRFVQCDSIQVQHRYQTSWQVECILGEPLHKLKIRESNLNYMLEFKSGANTGLFLDMKNGRDWVCANSKNKRVLNLFAYTCGFSIAASAGGARSVFNIDMNSPFLNTGRENHRLNKQSLRSIRFDKLNILKSFGRIKKQGPYDLIICDPPTFQKGSIDLARDYSKIIRRLVEFLSEDAKLFLCINTPHIGSITGKEFLLQAMQENAPDFHLIDEIKPPSVFKDIQGKGTKILIFKIRKERG